MNSTSETTSMAPPTPVCAEEVKKEEEDNTVWHIVNLYHFAPLSDVPQVRRQIQAKCQDLHLRGSLWVASEGFNGTLASEQSPDSLYDIIRYLETSILLQETTQSKPSMGNQGREGKAASSSSSSLLECKFSIATVPPYPRMLVKIKKELVTMGIPSLLATLCENQRVVGNYVEPKDWNALITSPNVLLIDVRNDYEVELGTFQGAVNPNTKSFSEFPHWWQTEGQAMLKKREEGNSAVEQSISSTSSVATATNKSSPSSAPAAVAMFCTGGIRCEKSTHYLLQRQQHALQLLPPNTPVYHLKGGILNYLEMVENPNDSTWNGHCFVFDQRVSVTHGLQPGPHTLCYACRRPFLLPRKTPESTTMSDQDDDDTNHLSSLYEPGVSCPRCYYETTDEQKRRFRERQQQKQPLSDPATTSNSKKKNNNKTNKTAFTVPSKQQQLQDCRDKKRKYGKTNTTVTNVNETSSSGQ